MKIICMVLLAFGGAALSGGMVYAAPSGQTTREGSALTGAASNSDTTAKGSKAVPSVDKVGQRTQQLSRAQAKSADSIRRQVPSLGKQMDAVRPAQHLSGARRMGAEKGLDPQQLRQLQGANVQRGLRVQIAPSHAGPATRATRPNAQLLGTVPHRGVNPPAISGAATARRVDRAAINGSEVRSKP